MNRLSEFVANMWAFLNHPILVINKSPVSLWVIMVNAFCVLAFFVITYKLKKWAIEILSKRYDVSLSDWRAVVTLVYYTVLGLGLVVFLQSTGLDLRLLTVLTGAVGIGIGFGMQFIFSNFISGIIILMEKPLRLGDRIEVGTVSGNVKSISVRATTIVTNDNVSIIVPNSDFISKQVINWSHSGNNVRISISVRVAYNSEPKLVEKLLREVALAEPGVLENPEPVVRLTEFGDSGLHFSLLVWTHEFSSRIGALRSRLNFGVLEAFREHKVAMPFPQRDIHIHKIAENEVE